MNRICVLDVDLQGVRNIKKTDLRPIYIFVQPPSLDVLVGGGPGLGWGGRGWGQGPPRHPDPPLCLRSSDCGSGTQRLRRAWLSGWLLLVLTWRAVSVGTGHLPSPQAPHPPGRPPGSLVTRDDPALPLSPSPGKEQGLFDLIIINDNLDKAYQALEEALSEVGSAGSGLLCSARRERGWDRQCGLSPGPS